MQLVVGLGNPGPQYERTRHNIGFMLLDLLHQQGQSTPWKHQYRSEFCSTVLGGRKVWLCRPQTFMNLSGEAVAAAAAFYHIPRPSILVVSDDFALPLGKVRIRDKGSSGGHNGLTSITKCLGGDDYARLRLGVGPLPPRWDAADFVLGPFTAAEQPLLAEILKLSVEATLTLIDRGAAAAMNQYNGMDLRVDT